MNSNRNTARIAGLLFLAGTVTALPMSFTESIVNAPNYLTGIAANSTQVLIGALLGFLAAVFSGSIAISLYPVLKKYNEALALGAVGFRLLEPVFYIVNIIGILSLVTISQDFVRAGAPAASTYQIVGAVIQAARAYASYAFGVSTFSLGALMYYVVFYQSRLIPRWLSVWGLIAATLSGASAFLVMFGLKPLSPFFTVLILPIFFQEIVLEGWLIFKGFNPSAIASLSAK
ncbi:hypothetical protein KSF_011620 [Reticulibacter mediterranei]|uniref:DUF4386 domain-containing protein n=1 Tax=Reticulibacter mediterranei TaxID=2778369 RepID=A0A8J3IH15_9CHLR|nr:DUF4386 domain-containing protein [Reticulibacter mediterranei]GHO91114.1 hypothetical protein KSF_011620 [Reticulibacter mediterranei]